ncbi:energy transducer TonB [Tunturibacter empetritectus]|uniref:TonB family protein n=1 Tax=Tunturiibacter lichenicola TaxID=2051959 RepID=A0A7W8J7U7_9BACT|nr:energy transducer TonB [Edaphobacter lichenicola]MBB5344257.1 TonB family protein [Edaphobacter lichenicola]
MNHPLMPQPLRNISSLVVFLLLPALARPETLQDNPTATAPLTGSQSQTLEVAKVGKDVSSPILTHSTEPKIPKAAHKAKLDGFVIVNCYVEPDGTTSNVHVAHTIIKGANSPADQQAVKELEESAIGAVQSYKFKPSRKNGQPVRVELNVQVHFKS